MMLLRRANDWRLKNADLLRHSWRSDHRWRLEGRLEEATDAVQGCLVEEAAIVWGQAWGSWKIN